MNQEAKEKLERTLREYWKSKQKLWGLERGLELVEKEIKRCRTILAEKEDLIPSPTQLSFTLGVAGGGSCEFTPVERTLQLYEMTQISLIQRIKELRQKQAQLSQRIFKIRFSNDWIDYIAENHLDDFERKIFEQCYAYGRSNIQVGIALNCDEATVRRKREKILLTFYEFLRIRA
ncbi:hypothetical protein BR63_05700 [Thermanaerosceptrum fracticalcis]|uniref:Uncharacterized protein n=1 Tax=Thermanaerosceptrum fracticalcis TaxID=1712410 RepID=A0A7G6E199_THEFR|nr:hypothetical protein [Thermanaerosceptrum fracticalcis]QNB45853.1 hypothetical protein BR63_05700 [Thermanaerosceptrum fracticalcis]